MLTLTPVERAVLDGASHAPEILEQIYLRLHTPPASVALADAADAIRSLLKQGLLKTEPAGGSPDDPAVIWTSSFSATPEGREVLADGPLPPPPGWPEGRIYPGMFRGLIPDLSAEEIDQARRAMLGNFAE